MIDGDKSGDVFEPVSVPSGRRNSPDGGGRKPDADADVMERTSGRQGVDA